MCQIQINSEERLAGEAQAKPVEVEITFMKLDDSASQGNSFSIHYGVLEAWTEL